MTLNREQMLIEMGIRPLWALREAAPAPALHAVPAPADDTPPASGQTAAAQDQTAPAAAAGAAVPTANLAADPATLAWPELAEAIRVCRACGLCERRRQAVPGVGDMQADWLFIGEGPGSEEDARGEPFVGAAGQLLDAMLAALDLTRQKAVYIANAVKCRPPGNRTPESGEIEACRPWLQRQIVLLQPKIIVLLGKTAAQSLLGKQDRLADLRRQIFDYEGIPVVVTYHPAYLLRNLPDKAKAWEDLLRARRLLRAAG